MTDNDNEQPLRSELSGRLELTWTNKHLRLLADDDGSHQWVPPSDWRVSEVRLIEDVGSHGELRSTRRAANNLLIEGDALNALTSLSSIPEFSREYAGKIKLCYIDPPFNTQQSFLQYDDALEHSVWLTMMRDRLMQVKEMLDPNGSIWVHLDDSEMAYAKIVLDEIFGRDKFVATIIWQKKYSRDNRPAIGSVHDYILVYSPLGGDWKHHRNRLPRDEKTAKQYRNPNNDPRGDWRAIPMTAQGYRPNQMYKIVTPTGVVHSPPKGRCWSMLESNYKDLLKQDRIYFGLDGNAQPGVIKYLDETEGLVPWTWWPHEEVGHTDEAKKEILGLFPDTEPFDTPKPERLMNRIIHMATKPGEIVLDFFGGSGSTAAVATKMNRRWVLIERSKDNLKNYTVPRLRKVIDGNDGIGVTESLGWQGGSGYVSLQVAPSMFDEDDGVVYLADWATNGRLSEVTAAQLGFDYSVDPPFSGWKGRSRLTVIDGLVNEAVVRAVVSSLGPTERSVICGTAIDPDCRPSLKDPRPGSTLRKLPSSILQEYRARATKEVKSRPI